MPETQLTSPLGSWQLHRFPRRSREILQAWDAGDILLHQQLAENIKNGQAPQHPLLVNDQFGALLMPLASTDCACISDSYVSHLAWQTNLADNQLPRQHQALSPLAELPTDRDLVLLKLPKSQSLLHFQLARMAQTLPAGTPLYATAKSGLFTPNVRALFAEYCDQVDVSLVQRKHRVLSARIKSVATDFDQFMQQWSLPEYNLQLNHHAGVFARNQLDIGARFMLQHLPAAGARKVIDLGCGNGVLGLAYALQSPTSDVLWVDDSMLAIASCELNIKANLTATAEPQRYRTRVDDCLSHQASASADLIICNPPFHQEHAVTEHIALQMFRDAKRVLESDGKLLVVANRHLPYYQALQREFRTVTTRGEHPKFVIYEATK